MSQEPTDVQYKTWGMPTKACKLTGDGLNMRATAYIANVTCETCRHTQIFQEHVTLKEVGFGGNFTEFYEHLKQLVITD